MDWKDKIELPTDEEHQTFLDNIEKAGKNPKLVKKTIMVTRGGKTHRTTVWVNPNEKKATFEVDYGKYKENVVVTPKNAKEFLKHIKEDKDVKGVKLESGNDSFLKEMKPKPKPKKKAERKVPANAKKYMEAYYKQAEIEETYNKRNDSDENYLTTWEVKDLAKEYKKLAQRMTTLASKISKEDWEDHILPETMYEKEDATEHDEELIPNY